MAYALALGLQIVNDNNIVINRLFCNPMCWDLGTSKRIFPLKLNINFIYDHNTFSIHIFIVDKLKIKSVVTTMSKLMLNKPFWASLTVIHLSLVPYLV